MCVAIAVTSLAGCKGSSKDSASSAAPILAPDVLQAICSHEPCGGDRPTINVYRNGDGEIIKLYRMYGACFHSPGIYFEPNGTLIETIPEKAMIPGSTEAIEIQTHHERQVGGLKLTDVVRCSDGARIPPP